MAKSTIPCSPFGVSGCPLFFFFLSIHLPSIFSSSPTAPHKLFVNIGDFSLVQTFSTLAFHTRTSKWGAFCWRSVLLPWNCEGVSVGKRLFIRQHVKQKWSWGNSCVLFDKSWEQQVRILLELFWLLHASARIHKVGSKRKAVCRSAGKGQTQKKKISTINTSDYSLTRSYIVSPTDVPEILLVDWVENVIKGSGANAVDVCVLLQAAASERLYSISRLQSVCENGYSWFFAPCSSVSENQCSTDRISL